MNKCPFWSSKKSKVDCYKECPMKSIEGEESECIFMEYLDDTKIDFKGIDSKGLDYAGDEVYNSNYLTGTSNY